MKVLVLAPHADDEVLGMGGTLARYAQAGHECKVVVLTGEGGAGKHPFIETGSWDTVRAECRAAADILGVSGLEFEELPAACLDYTPGWQTNNVINTVIRDYKPDELYVPFAHDLHRDHGAVAYGASVAARPYLSQNENLKRVLAYETLSETHLATPHLFPGFQPNFYINITDTLDVKLDAMRAYKSQIQPKNLPRSVEALRALARLRGTHIGCDAAEGFMLLGEYQR